MRIKLHEDNYIQADSESMLADSLRAVFPYRGAALTLEWVQARIDSGHKLDVYKYEIVDGGIVAKDSSPFFIMDSNWISPVFDSKSATIKYGAEIITPETIITDDLVKVFADTIYSYNDDEYRKKWEAIQLEVFEVTEASLTPEQEKAIELAKAEKIFNDEVDALTAGYTENEVKSWDQKAREASIILTGSSEPTYLIDALSDATGRDRTELAQSIDEKARIYTAAYAAAEVKMLATKATLNA